MPQENSPPDSTPQATVRRRIGRYMLSGGLLGWGVVACVTAGAFSEHGSVPAAVWFTTAFIILLGVLGLLVKGYQLETQHNPNFAPHELARGGANVTAKSKNTTGKMGN